MLPPMGAIQRPVSPHHEALEPAENGYPAFLRASLSAELPVVADPSRPTPAEQAGLAKASRAFQEMLDAARKPGSQRYEKLPVIDPEQPNYAYSTEKKLIRCALAEARRLQPKQTARAQALRQAAYALATRLAEEHAPLGAALASADMRAQVRAEWDTFPPGNAAALYDLEAQLPLPARFLSWEVEAAQRGLIAARAGGPLESYPGLEGRAQDGLVRLLGQQLLFLPTYEALDVPEATRVQQSFFYHKAWPGDFMASAQLAPAPPNYARLLGILRADRVAGRLLVTRQFCREYRAQHGKLPPKLEEAFGKKPLFGPPLPCELKGDKLLIGGETFPL